MPFRTARLALLLPFLLAPVGASALEPAVGAEAMLVHARIAGESFDPVAARVRLSLAFNADWEAGLLAGSGIADDTEVSVTASAGSFQAAYVRYSASLDDNARLALMVGYGEMTLDVVSRLPAWPGSQTYSGVVYGLSLQERLSRYPRWTGSLDLERWYDHQGLRIGAVSYGFRYAF